MCASKNDHEIGYAIVNPPGLYVVPGINDSAAQLNANNSGQNGAVSNEFLNDLAGLLSKYVGPVGGAPVGKDAVLDVATGKLTLEQINLLFRHLPVDLSYVDENELVKFYSDTPHIVFSHAVLTLLAVRLRTVISKSVHVVEEIVENSVLVSKAKLNSGLINRACLSMLSTRRSVMKMVNSAVY